MGIDGFWIGYEGTRSGYAKQQGRPIEDILTEFRAHGITVLTSMILGFDYQTPEIIAQELDGLMKLKPALAQFLIYGPPPGTPFFERAVKDNLLHEKYVKEPELMYRRGDGFATMIKHPTLSPEEIEELQRWCFTEDFQRLGPSIFRTLEARLLGCRKLRNSLNPRLREKGEYYAKELRAAYPAFLAGRLLGPNSAVRHRIGRLEQRVHALLGTPTLRERLKSVLAVGAAVWAGVTLKLDLFQHPKLMRTTYRMPDKRWAGFELWEELRRKAPIPELSVQVDLQPAHEQVWVRLEGVLSAAEADGLGQRIRDSLARSKSRLVLDLKKLQWDKADDLRALTERLSAFRSRVRLILPKVAAAHPEVILLASMFHHYKG
jgi:hypothetical protein